MHQDPFAKPDAKQLLRLRAHYDLSRKKKKNDKQKIQSSALIEKNKKISLILSAKSWDVVYTMKALIPIISI